MEPATMGFEDLIQKQLAIEQGFQQMWINFKKDSTSRYNKQYFTQRLENLRLKWAEFQVNDEVLGGHAEAQREHEYFTRGFFKNMEKKYEEIRARFQAELLTILKSEQTSKEVQRSSINPTGSDKVCTSNTGTIQKENYNVMGKRLEILRTNFSRIKDSIDLSKSTVALQFKAEQLSSCWAMIKKLNEDILVANENDDQSSIIELEEVYEDTYISLQEEVNARSKESPDPQSSISKNLKLPQLNMPIFSGRYEEWTPFWELFERLVHGNKGLSDVERMQYLKSSVHGEASRLMNHLSVTAVNYPTAIELLTKRYQNPAALVNNFITKLLTLKAVRNENAYDLKTIMDSAREILYGLSNLGVDTSSWDPLVIQLLLPKLDNETRKLYQQMRGASTDIPKLNDLFDFIEGRFRGIENSREGFRDHNRENKMNCQSSASSTKNHLTTISSRCPTCNESHQIYSCKKFLDMDTNQRRQSIQRARLCFNCLRGGHGVKQCTSIKRCTTCKEKHNSLLHEQQKPTNPSAIGSANGKKRSSATSTSDSTEVAAAHDNTQEKAVLLATAIVNINIKGYIKSVRALIDQGSQSCIVTEALARSLKIPLQKYGSQVNGINGHSTQVVAKCALHIQSIHDDKNRCKIEAIVMPRITSRMPNKELNPKQWQHIEGLQLADPWYSEPREIQLLIGADVFPEIIKYGMLKGPIDTPMAQNTIFGWILSGPVISAPRIEHQQRSISKISSYVSICSDDDDLKKFWELEEIPNAILKTNSERQCEDHYETTHTRDDTGRYIVRLPLQQDRFHLGDSKKMALKRFFLLEQRLTKNPTLRQEYSRFIQEYIELGHMTEVAPATMCKAYYLPHHAVIKEDSTTTKLRVVFDASAKTTSGESLNSIMMIGPTLQKDLLLLLLQWRAFPIVFTADVEKMYRQILVHEEDRDLQRMLWREDPIKPIKEYRLNTVTYGTASAPYLAIKTLMKLAEDEKSNHPLAYDTLSQRFYVDDCLGGADSIDECKTIQQELVKLLQKGGFKLRKWTSNSPEILQGMPIEDLETRPDMEFIDDKAIKILGIKWCPKTDQFKFRVNMASFSLKMTKRAVLSDAGKLFDPFGWLSPITIKAKIMIQKLWLLGIGWDSEIPSSLQAEWQEFKTKLPSIERIKIPRWIQQTKNSIIELHGFADASEAAYAAVVYARIINGRDVTISLIASKTKVAPIKQVSLARLELCAAALLTKLINYVQTGTGTKYKRVIAWSDSTIVLNWLKQHPVKWTTFVANRVSYIQENLRGQFRFVPGTDNPADIPSRGSFGDDLISNSLWWQGPKWLKMNESCWPPDNNLVNLQDIPETRKSSTCMVTQLGNCDEDLTNRFSSLTKLLRVTAWCKRFMFNSRVNKRDRKNGYLTVDEINEAERTLVKSTQQHFKEDIEKLKQQEQSIKSSKIYSLNPFIDGNGILRVGGRLKHTNLPTDQKHPMILHQSSTLARLIINQAHLTTMHGGIKLTLNYTRNKFWIIRGALAVKSVINKCIKCFRFKAKAQTQLMGQLPAPRVNFSRPFTHCGVDYAGPIHIRCSKYRGVKSYKSYIALFVCLATKAVHIELTSDLTTDGFLAALKRMINRRGSVHHIYSDNGTNFVGANNILQKAQKQLIENGIRWHFIPPGSPHMGGLWESGVKSIKHHLSRIVGEQKLTYEEMNTILVQIEGCLNSRPLSPLSDNIEELDALTPGHFIIGSALMTPAYDSVINWADSSLKRWKLIQKIKQDICTQWYRDYIKIMQQQRYKWTNQTPNLKEGQLVLLKDEALASSTWPLGRILQVHKGTDGLARVATIKTQKATVKRSIQKICLLPIDENTNQDQIDQPLIQKAATPPTNSPEPRRNIKDIQNRSGSASSKSVSTVITLLLLLTNFHPSNSKHTITHPEAGLFIENIGTAKIQRGILRTRTSFQISDIMQDQTNLNKTKDQMTTLCNEAKTLTQDSQCDELVHHLNEEWKNIYVTFNRLNLIHRRQKRGLVGTILTSLFGVNDEVYHDIDSLDENQKVLIKTTNSNTKLMLSAMAAVNDTETRIATKMKNFTKKLNEGIQAINDMRPWYKMSDANQVNIHILNTYLIASSFIKEIDNKYNKLLNAYLRRSHLYEFLSHEKIHEITTNCTSKLGSHLQVQPEPLNKLDFAVTTTEIIIRGYFIITDAEEYELMKINAVPERIENNTFKEIQITAPIVGVNYNLDRYFESSLGSIVKASKWNETTFILQPAIFFKIDQSENCIIQQLYKKLSVKKCTTRTFKSSTTIWKELWTQNAWMFTTPGKTTVFITCGSMREEVVLNETGIIHISPECNIQSRRIRLEARLTEELPVMAHYSKPMEVANMSTDLRYPIQINNETIIPLTEDLSTVFQSTNIEATNTLHQLHEVKWKAIWKHQSWMTGITSTIAVVLGFIILATILRLVINRKRAATPTSIELREVRGHDNSAFDVKW